MSSSAFDVLSPRWPSWGDSDAIMLMNLTVILNLMQMIPLETEWSQLIVKSTYVTSTDIYFRTIRQQLYFHAIKKTTCDSSL